MNIDQILASMPDAEVDYNDQPDEHGDDFSELDDVVDAATNQPEPGIKRHVDGARLVSKRKSDDGTFTELWVFHTTNLRDDLKIRRAIVGDTDIPVGASESPTGEQRLETWAVGNIEFVSVTGLPN